MSMLGVKIVVLDFDWVIVFYVVLGMWVGFCFSEYECVFEWSGLM